MLMGFKMKNTHQSEVYPKSWTTMFSARIISSRGSGYLPEFRRGHPFCFALDPFVVVIVDVFLYGRVQVVERLEFRLMAVEHLVLEGPEERPIPFAWLSREKDSIASGSIILSRLTTTIPRC